MAELSEALDLVSIKDRPWHVQPTTAIRGDGLDDGFGWYSPIPRPAAVVLILLQARQDNPRLINDK